LPVQLIAHSATEARIENGMDLAIGRPSSTRQDESKLNTAVFELHRWGDDEQALDARVDSQLLDLVPERAFADVEQRGGPRLVAGGLPQCFDNQLAFEPGDGAVQ